MTYVTIPDFNNNYCHVLLSIISFPLQGQPTGSVTATDRLMKELRDIYRSEHYKSG